MIRLFVAGLSALVMQSPESITVTTAKKAPVVDGKVFSAEYGAPKLRFPGVSGDVSVSLTRSGGYLYIAAELPDTSMYWGDDFVVSFDLNGSGGDTPDVGDQQWYLRRVLDSSVVFVVDQAAKGRWVAAGITPPLLKEKRHDADWDVASSSTAQGWSVELRVREGIIPKGAKPRVTFRTYNDKPRGWRSYPKAAADSLTLRVERNPGMWIPLLLR
jgi:hypothetical protein